MLNWLVGNIAEHLVASGHGWDEEVERLEDALEHAPLAADRLRLLASLALIESARGQDTSAHRAEIVALSEPIDDDETVFVRNVALADIAFAEGDLDAVHRLTDELRPKPVQALEIPAIRQFHAAVWSGREDRIRAASAWIDSLPGWGLRKQGLRQLAAAAVDALEGRRGEAAAVFRDVHGRMVALGESYAAAQAAIDVLHLLRDDPEVRSRVADARPLLVELGARVALQRADALLAQSPPVSPAPIPAAADERVPG